MKIHTKLKELHTTGFAHHHYKIVVRRRWLLLTWEEVFFVYRVSPGLYTFEYATGWPLEPPPYLRTRLSTIMRDYEAADGVQCAEHA